MTPREKNQPESGETQTEERTESQENPQENQSEEEETRSQRPNQSEEEQTQSQRPTTAQWSPRHATWSPRHAPCSTSETAPMSPDTEGSYSQAIPFTMKIGDQKIIPVNKKVPKVILERLDLSKLDLEKLDLSKLDLGTDLGDDSGHCSEIKAKEVIKPKKSIFSRFSDPDILQLHKKKLRAERFGFDYDKEMEHEEELRRRRAIRFDSSYRQEESARFDSYRQERADQIVLKKEDQHRIYQMKITRENLEKQVVRAFKSYKETVEGLDEKNAELKEETEDARRELIIKHGGVMPNLSLKKLIDGKKRKLVREYQSDISYISQLANEKKSRYDSYASQLENVKKRQRKEFNSIARIYNISAQELANYAQQNSSFKAYRSPKKTPKPDRSPKKTPKPVPSSTITAPVKTPKPVPKPVPKTPKFDPVSTRQRAADFFDDDEDLGPGDDVYEPPDVTPDSSESEESEDNLCQKVPAKTAKGKQTKQIPVKGGKNSNKASKKNEPPAQPPPPPPPQPPGGNGNANGDEEESDSDKGSDASAPTEEEDEEEEKKKSRKKKIKSAEFVESSDDEAKKTEAEKKTDKSTKTETKTEKKSSKSTSTKDKKSEKKKQPVNQSRKETVNQKSADQKSAASASASVSLNADPG